MIRWICFLFLVSCVSKTKDLAVPDFDHLWNYSKPAQTRQAFFEWLEEHREEVPQDILLQLQTQIARTYSLEKNFTEAHKRLDEVESRLAEFTKTAEVRYLLERGRTFNSAGEKNKARPVFKKAYELAVEIENFRLSVDAAHMLALAAESFAEKMSWNQKGLVAAENSGDEKTRRWIGSLRNNIGWDLFEEKEYEKAFAEFKLCQEFYQSIGDSKYEAIARWSQAKVLRYLEQFEAALSIQKELLRESGGIDESGYTYEELAELYLALGQKERAQDFFSKAYEILSQDSWLQKNESQRLSRMKKLARL